MLKLVRSIILGKPSLRLQTRAAGRRERESDRVWPPPLRSTCRGMRCNGIERSRVKMRAAASAVFKPRALLLAHSLDVLA